MRKDLIFKYFSSIINRLELISRHLKGEMLENNDPELLVSEDSSSVLNNQEIEILHFFLEEIAIKTNQLKKLMKIQEEED